MVEDHAQERKFSVGQEWAFEGRPTDPSPTLVVVLIENVEAIGEVLHVSLRGLRIRNPSAPGGFSGTLPHAPFSRTAIDRSVKRLVQESVPLPAYQEGYQLWKEARGGVFTITVREVADLVESRLR